MTTIINPRRINRTIVVERDSRTLTARVIDALDAPNGMAEMLADAEAARDDAQQAVTDAQVIKDGLLDDLTVTANTLAPGAAATAVWDGNAQLLTLGIPEGQPGDVSGMVRFDAPQTLTAPQQEQARSNIGAASLSRTITAGAGLTGGGDLTADLTIAADFATQAEALAGIATDKVMSPARVADVLAWRAVAHVPASSGAAVTITGLDLSKKTVLVFRSLSASTSAAATLRMEYSTDGGSSWSNYIPVSGSSDRAAFPAMNAMLLYTVGDSLFCLSGSGGGSLTSGRVAPAGVNALRFFWSTGAAFVPPSGSSDPGAGHIDIHQRG